MQLTTITSVFRAAALFAIVGVSQSLPFAYHHFMADTEQCSSIAGICLSIFYYQPTTISKLVQL